MRRALAIRGAVFSVLVPGVVAGWVPLQLAERPAASGAWSAGWLLVAASVVVYLGSLLRFLNAGGTPMIYFARRLRFLVGEEPHALVTRGLYDRTRNPMYLAVVGVIAGQAVAFASLRIAVYAAVMFVLFNGIVVLLEEPHLRAARGAEYDDYCRRVPRWL